LSERGNNELEIEEIRQRDVPEIATLPSEIHHLNYNFNRKEDKEEVVKERKNYSKYVIGLVITIIIQCVLIGLIVYYASEIEHLQHIVKELSEKERENSQNINMIYDELGSKIKVLNKSFNERMGRMEENIEVIPSTDGIIEFNKREYNIGDKVCVIVMDADMDKDMRKRDKVSVVIKNANKGEQIPMDLFEISENSGVFVGKFMLMKETDESIPGIGANINDTISAIYYDKNTVNGTPCVFIALANVTGVIG